MVVATLIKLALVAGTVWFTREIGVWEGADKTAEVYEDIKVRLTPIAEDLKQKYCSKCCTENKKNARPWREAFVYVWNESVREGFTIVARYSHYCHRFTEDLQNALNRLFKGASE